MHFEREAKMIEAPVSSGSIKEGYKIMHIPGVGKVVIMYPVFGKCDACNKSEILEIVRHGQYCLDCICNTPLLRKALNVRCCDTDIFIEIVNQNVDIQGILVSNR